MYVGIYERKYICVYMPAVYAFIEYVNYILHIGLLKNKISIISIS